MSASTMLIFFLFCVSTVTSERVQIDEPLGKFLGTLESYANTQNDVVFLLDESGSIGVDKFPQVKLFAKLTAQRLAVSAEDSRIAVVTFATETITHIDYIKNPYGNNMCTLLKEIDDIGYVGEWTHTDKAMKAAENILSQARPDSKKLIVLLTDGQSNDGHSPVDISNKLKSKGIIIFAIGVADVNVEEINSVATSPDHVYILRDFDYITKVNIYLVNDTREVSMDLVKNPSYCNTLCNDQTDCCDDNADCYCGTRTGRYECACNAGYHGRGGFKGQCHKCSKGTYKAESRNTECTPCPEFSTTDKEGSTSYMECKCQEGYEKIGSVCSPVRCASLSPPVGGLLIPKHCNNTYGMQCSFQCLEGYCPFSCRGYDPQQRASMPSRTCLDTRAWSGEEFHCEKMICPALNFPANGNHNCSENDFTFGTTCQFKCDKGYELTGSEHRTCLFNSWTGGDVTCKEISCDPLKTNDLLHVKPVDCSAKPRPYRSVCQYHCAPGYSLMNQGNGTDGSLRCQYNRKWSGAPEKAKCIDTQAPVITCPKSIQREAELHKGFVRVEWDYPNATDNVKGAKLDIKMIEPKGMQKAASIGKNQKSQKVSYDMPIGSRKVVYQATDRSNLSTTCSFTVEVLDKEPPKVISCPSDIEIFHATNKEIPVQWPEPVFEDNSKTFEVTSNRKSGDKFAWGGTVASSTVTYNATDKAGNRVSCSFQVRVKPYPCPYYDPPANGVVTCDNWADGMMCSIFCHDGFEFAAELNVPKIFICKQGPTAGGKGEGVWGVLRGPRGFKMPWPDCSRKQAPSSLNVTVGVDFSVESCSDEVLKKMRERFYNIIDDMKSPFFCPKHKGCSPENVKITCSPVSSRARRNAHFESQDAKVLNTRNERDLPTQILSIQFNVQVFPNATGEELVVKAPSDPGAVNEIDLSSSPQMKDLEDRISLQVKDAYNVTTDLHPHVNYDVIVMCSVGQINVNSSCVNCPAGTYKEDVSETCIVCPTATYQNEERQLSCKACPVGYTTHEVKSKSKDDCKAPCQPGFYSETTFEPCLACPLNKYQERAARKECMKCPSGLHTWRVGANSSKDCVSPCKPGTFSDTGYEPCTSCNIGTFQDQEMQTDCTICPNRTSTTVKGSKTITDCKEIDICGDIRPCQHDAQCVQIDKDYECRCPEGLMGKDCEINVDDCASDPCLNNGTCLDGIGNFTCDCLGGWEGRQCQTNIDDCESDPCFNGGECVDQLNAYDCLCAPGFAGPRCEMNIYECEPNPCLNNGTCFDKQNGYRCCCAKGFDGPNCENILESPKICDTVQCHNGGSCSEDGDGFACVCREGFDGEFCEINVDDCEHFQCHNDGVCVDGVGNATCSCSKKFIGAHCEEGVKPEFTLTFPTPSTSNYVELNNVRRLYAITVSFFMRTSYKDSSSRATPVSYSYKYQDHLVDNALTLLDTNNFVLYIHGQTIHTEFSGNKDTSWHHYAVTWEKMGGKWSFYVDGKSIAHGRRLGENKYMHPGTFVLGQEQDDVGSTFSALEAFAGDITEFNVWDYAMTAEEVQKISTSCGYVGNLIPWYTVSHFVSGDVGVLHDVDKCRDLGTCPENSCDCFYSNETRQNSCKHIVDVCTDDTCSNGQNCVSDGELSFCDCGQGFEGRRCEYDIDECLEKNGDCTYICVNDIGTGSYHCECPEDMILADDGKKCKDTSYCLKDGKAYLNGETWVEECRYHVCDLGVVQREEIVCNETACRPEETMLMSPGECCPKCVAWSLCLISPDSTLMSFDNSKYQIDGGCNYTAVEDCIEGRFKVEVEFSPNGTQLVVYQDCSKVTISSDGSVLVDDILTSLPYENEGWMIDQLNSSITLKTNSDLLVEWNVSSEGLIAIPITHANRMCGLCSRIEEYYTYNTEKIPLKDRWASVRLISSDFYTFIRSDF